MARSTVFRYKDATADPVAIGRELNVRAVLTGRVLQHGDDFKISTELVDARDGSRLWGNTYQRPFQQIFGVQEEIASEISDNLRLQLTPREKRRLTKRPTENREAYQLYLKGRFFWNKRTEEGLRKSIEYFRQAVDIDPTYSLAYSGLAEAYMPLAFWCHLAPKDAFPKIKGYALKALEIDDQSPEALVPLSGSHYLYEHDWESSEKALRKAIEINPNYARAHQVYAEFLSFLGEFEAAATKIHEALMLDPLSPILHVSDAYRSYFAREYDEVAPKCQRALDLEPTFPIAHLGLGVLGETCGRFERAIEHLQRALEAEQHSLVLQAELGRAYALAGKHTQARTVLRSLHETANERYVSPYMVARIYAGMCDKEQAVMWLDRASEERSSWMVMLNVDPAFDFLRSEPEFQDLIRRAKLPTRNTSAAAIYSKREK
jgi:tetratricopeptide (TPR) repeat protein